VVGVSAAVRLRGPGQRWWESVLPVALMFVAATYFLLPLWWLFVAATKERGDLTTTPGLWFSDFRFGANVSDLVARSDGVFWRWVLNSVLYAGVGAAIGTLLAAMAGYALAKYEFRGRELVFSVILAGVLVPASALALPQFLLLSEVELTNTYWAVLVPSVVSPFGVYLSRIYAAGSVPDDLIEAGRLDGAGELRIFFTVAVRLMVPALVTIYLFQFVTIWNNFFLPLIMLVDQDLFPVTLGLFTWSTQNTQDPTLTTAVIVGAFVSIVPLVAAFLMLQRYWRSGLGTGAVKG
jgi:multiple sugar transport system permease protein